MGRLSIDQLKPGMILGEDLIDANGRTLLGKGAELSEKHFRILKMWGVMDAEVEGISAQDVEADATVVFDPQIVHEAKRYTKERFRLVDLNYPGVNELYRLCILRRIRRISQGKIKATDDLSNAAHTKLEVESRVERLPHVNSDELLRDGIKLPSLPTIFLQIQDIINNPNSSTHSIANVIGKDAGLATCLLRLVNSSFYGYPSKIDSLSRAVTIVGTKQLSTLALGVTMINVFKDIPKDLIDLQSFWKHSIACGIISRVLAKYKNISNNERLFVGGLLHDIGRMIVYGYLPKHAKEALLRASKSDSSLQEAEREVIGFTHQSIGTSLLKKWKLPLTLESMVRYHHNPMASKQPMDSAIVHIADVLANALEVGTSGERLVPLLSHHAWETLGMPTSILGPTITQLDNQINEIIKLFLVDR